MEKTALETLRDNWLEANNKAKAAKTDVNWMESVLNNATMLVGQAVAANTAVAPIDKNLAKKASDIVALTTDFLNDSAKVLEKKAFEAGTLEGRSDSLWNIYKSAEEAEKQRAAEASEGGAE